MKKHILFAVALLLTLDASAADAQRRGGGGNGWGFTPLAHRAEITGYGGYFWSSDYDVRLGTSNRFGSLDVKSNAFWGVELDINVRPGAQVALLYNRADSELTFREDGVGVGQEKLGDVAVEYWHIGGLSGIARGNLMPFGGLTLGATRYSSGNDDAWKFSLMPQLGIKIFPHPKIGIRAQARLPITIIDGGLALGFGSGGSFVSVGGYGVFQFDVSGGIMILI